MARQKSVIRGGEKWCQMCGTWKLLDCFKKDFNAPCGYRAWCIECTRKYMHDWHATRNISVRRHKVMKMLREAGVTEPQIEAVIEAVVAFANSERRAAGQNSRAEKRREADKKEAVSVESAEKHVDIHSNVRNTHNVRNATEIT